MNKETKEKIKRTLALRDGPEQLHLSSSILSLPAIAIAAVNVATLAN
jgi:hypothetical protein